LPHRRDHERLEANAEHRRREDAAPRLCDEITTLKTLRMHFEERRDAGRVTAMAYSKPIVVTSAAASFELRCMEPRCDGRHDITRQVMAALRQRQTTFSGESECQGAVKDVGCTRVLLYSFVATYSS
jgi:hypothetical protein